jgi:HK97 family phage major capsid protein
MGNYDQVIDRTGAAGDVPKPLAEIITGDIEQESTAIKLGKIIPTTTRDSVVPVLTEAPDAYFVSGDAGLKRTSKMTLKDKPLVAEEIAVIVPIPDNVVADSEYNLCQALWPLIARAFARRVDRAVLFGEGKPASWTSPGVVPAAIAVGNAMAATDDPYVDLLGAARMVADADYNANGVAVERGWQFSALATRSKDLPGPRSAGRTSRTRSASPVCRSQPTRCCGIGMRALRSLPTGIACSSACGKTSGSKFLTPVS